MLLRLKFSTNIHQISDTWVPKTGEQGPLPTLISNYLTKSKNSKKFKEVLSKSLYTVKLTQVGRILY